MHNRPRAVHWLAAPGSHVQSVLISGDSMRQSVHVTIDSSTRSSASRCCAAIAWFAAFQDPPVYALHLIVMVTLRSLSDASGAALARPTRVDRSRSQGAASTLADGTTTHASRRGLRTAEMRWRPAAGRAHVCARVRPVRARGRTTRLRATRRAQRRRRVERPSRVNDGSALSVSRVWRAGMRHIASPRAFQPGNK